MRGLENRIPEGWRLATFDQLKAPGRYTLVGGPFGSSLTAKDYVSAGVPVIRGNNLDGKNSRFIDDDFAFVATKKADALHRNLAYAGDLVFTQRGTLGQVGIIPSRPRFPRYVVSQSQMKLTPHPGLLHAKFAYYYFRSNLADLYLRHTVLSTGVPHINLGILKEFPVLLPPLPEQRRIADILDKADAIRRKRQEAVKLADEFLRSTFLEMFGDLVTNPKGWPVLDMGSLVMESQYGTGSKANTEGKGLPVLRMNNITASGEIDLSDMKWCSIAESEREKYTLRPGDLLFNRTNSPELVGKTAVWDGSSGTHAYAGYLVRVRFNPERVLPDYVSGFLNSGYGKRYLFVKAKPSNNMSNFSASLFRTIPIPVPDLQTQGRFVELRVAARRVAARLEAAAADDAQLFDSLVQRAFRGEL